MNRSHRRAEGEPALWHFERHSGDLVVFRMTRAG